MNHPDDPHDLVGDAPWLDDPAPTAEDVAHLDAFIAGHAARFDPQVAEPARAWRLTGAGLPPRILASAQEETPFSPSPELSRHPWSGAAPCPRFDAWAATVPPGTIVEEEALSVVVIAVQGAQAEPAPQSARKLLEDLRSGLNRRGAMALFALALGAMLLSWPVRAASQPPEEVLDDIATRRHRVAVKRPAVGRRPTTSTLAVPLDRTFHPVDVATWAAGGHVPTHVSVAGRVAYTRRERDGDQHLKILGARDGAVILECIPEFPEILAACRRVQKGDLIDVTGISRYDTDHDYPEVHPVLSVSIVSTRPAGKEWR